MSGLWSKGVELNIDRFNVCRTIYTTADAAYYLLHKWPAEEGAEYRRARQVCLAALDGRRPANDAREAFLAAAKEADLLVKDQ